MLNIAATDASARKIHPLPGGLHLPDNKHQSSVRPIMQAALPKRLIIPLRQHAGNPAEPLVKAGDPVLKGQKIAQGEGLISAPLHAPSSGVVSAIQSLPAPHPSGLSEPCVVIETDGEERWAELPAPMDYRQANPAAILERVRAAGVVGLGGAAFPASVKLSPRPGDGLHTLIINGAECEPYITCDDLLMRERAAKVLAGIDIIRTLLQVEKTIIGIEDNKIEAIAAMRTARDLAGYEAMEIVVIPTRYPSGGEKQLIYILTGEEIPSGGIPAQIGMVCHNVGTAAAVADAVLEGKPLISRLITITGEGVAEPRNLEALMGSPVADLIAQAGGYTPKANKLILGGPMMGYTLFSDEIPIAKATNCILAASTAEAPDPGPALACIRCGRCAEACPMSLLPQQLYWHSRAKALGKACDYNLFDCIECGCCSHVCPSHIPLVQYFRFAKSEHRREEAEKRKAELAKRRHDARQERLERLEREKKEAMRKKQEAMKAKKTAAGGDAGDAKQAAIAAAAKRAAAKKAERATQGEAPKNTQGLSAAQQRQIDEAEARRAQARKTAHSEDRARPAAATESPPQD